MQWAYAFILLLVFFYYLYDMASVAIEVAGSSLNSSEHLFIVRFVNLADNDNI